MCAYKSFSQMSAVIKKLACKQAYGRQMLGLWGPAATTKALRAYPENIVTDTHSAYYI